MASPKLIPPNRRIAAKPLPTAAAGPRRMTRGRWLALAAAFIVCGLGVFWAVGHFAKGTRMSDIAELRERLLDPSLSSEDRQEIQDEMQRRMQSLMPELQRKTTDAGAAFMQFMTAHMKTVLALPDDKRMAAVDQDIDNWRSMSQMFGRGRGGGPPSASPSGTQKSDRPAGDRGGRGRPPGWPGPPSTDAQGKAWRNQMLSSIPADSRAQWQIYMQLVQARSTQRGITMPGGGGSR